MTLQRSLLLGLTILFVGFRSTEALGGQRDSDAPVRIVVTGRSDVWFTIRELIGNATKCEMPEENETLKQIYEYTITDIPGTDSSIKLLGLPAFADGRTLEKESQILATLKLYVSNASDGQPPDFFLALSGFDDNKFIGVDSLFVQFLKRTELFEHEFLRKVYGRNTNIVFLFTRMMSETTANQRRPASKINAFRNVISEYTRFPPPYQIVVGDNRAHSEYGAKIEAGYYRLPNKELYPKNVWDAMIHSSSSGQDDAREFRAALTAIRDNRETELKCRAEPFRVERSDEFNADVDAFLYLLQHLKNLTIEENEVNQKIEEVFDAFPKIPDQMNMVIQKTALQLNLQNQNITNKQAFPTAPTDKVDFFQKSSVISSKYAAVLLNASFQLEMPEYTQPLTVGYGYDVMADQPTLDTPFMNVKSPSSPIGYRFPNFMNCKRFPSHNAQTFQSYSQNISEYFTERLKHLHFKNEDINVAKFSGKIKSGHNVKPEEGAQIATLTAVEEIRTLECVLAEKEGELNNEFVATIRSLQPVNIYDRCSVRGWNNFFRKYGTHIVVQGYGGGSMVGSIVGTKVKKVTKSNNQSVIHDTLDSILDFSPFSVSLLEKPSYQLFGGRAFPEQNRDLYGIPAVQRDELLCKWESSLNSDFEMLKREFTLKRISTIVKEGIGESMGEMVDEAINLALKGGLKYQRTGKQSTLNNSRPTTRRPLSSTTAAPTSTDPVVEESQTTASYPVVNNQEDSDSYETYYAKRFREREERERLKDMEEFWEFLNR